MSLDRAKQGVALQMPSALDHVSRAERMVDGFGELGNDWPFIQIGRHIVRRRADHFHAAGMGLMIGACALESRQEGVMDIDAPLFETTAGFITQYLHIPGEYDEISLRVFNDAEQSSLSVRFCFLCHRNMEPG